MKPYSDVGQRSVKRGVGSAKKKKAAVQRSIAKAKVTAVKTQRKLTTSRASEEEIVDLLDASVATPSKPKTTAAARTATKPKPPLAKTAVPKKSAKSPPKKTVSVSKMERIRSMVNMSNGHSKLKASPSVATATPTRRSSRRATVASTAAINGSGTNGHHSGDVEMAEEAVEAQNNGFLKKTISKIWSTGSTSSLNAGPQQQQQQQQPPQASSSGGGGGGGCVIS